MFQTEGMLATGYQHPAYAYSLAEFGNPRILPLSQGAILERTIPGVVWRDAIGCYPLFTCQHWDMLGRDLEDLAQTLVAISVVTDPFGNYSTTLLAEAFPDLVRPYKQHVVIDLRHPVTDSISAHHWRNVQRADRVISVEQCAEPALIVDEWHALYQTLIQRHTIRGIARFSHAAFAAQLAIPGIVVFRALYMGRTVGMLLFYIQQGVAYYHLGAYDEEGYRLGASFSLFWHALQTFASSGLEWASLGAGAGVTGRQDDGLTRFKRGWSPEVRVVFLCGRILDRARYEQLCSSRETWGTGYFPAYRNGDVA